MIQGFVTIEQPLAGFCTVSRYKVNDYPRSQNIDHFTQPAGGPANNEFKHTLFCDYPHPISFRKQGHQYTQLNTDGKIPNHFITHHRCLAGYCQDVE